MMCRSVMTHRVTYQALRAIKNNGMWMQPALYASPLPHHMRTSVGTHGHTLSSFAQKSLFCCQMTPLSSIMLEQRKMMSTDAARSGNLMDFPHILFPSFMKMAKNVFFTWFIIRPYLDPNFSFKSFMDGAKQAMLVVSDRVSRGDFAGLQGLVTPEALAEIERNYSRLSVKERCDLRLQSEHIGPIFPYEIGMIIEEEEELQKRWVEITVCAHVHPNFAYQHHPSEQGFTPPYQMPDFTVCNYRFIRNYTKGVEDTWTVNVVNHFRPNADQDD
ncbi:uncharacterized protein LOC122372398 isoform X2 [Amphibalanus amphitrite]|uniref:uncharacterized protein LOC122372398 isoform X2 n=1 Tax=Amphibalanus amphitrite TaxID=1232801 RepID=UPI001C923802|nr:uncharacterized protein LOC122372398 isoform X2 [Amphibalanus amphitrite]XP_043205477.1 uncharacterized protein LOC122372398 isoform X2 [Amphibalanus amphitrite]XP_043205478.1 uncharacterized protein LOC122372398 isoform X2 [Amphibalanus amphitrite]